MSPLIFDPQRGVLAHVHVRATPPPPVGSITTGTKKVAADAQGRKSPAWRGGRGVHTHARPCLGVNLEYKASQIHLSRQR